MADLYNNKAYHPHSLILPSDVFGPFFVENHSLIPFEKNTTINSTVLLHQPSQTHEKQVGSIWKWCRNACNTFV